MKTYLLVPVSALSGALATMILGMAQGPSVLDHAQIATLTPMQREILSHLSIVYLDDGQGGSSKTIRLTGTNFQIVNGLGATNGYPTDPTTILASQTETNGVGNLVVGYNEHGNSRLGDDRTGSHNIVLGMQNTYETYGSLLGGRDNGILGVYASISGGHRNVAGGSYSSVSGGESNTASNYISSVSGGSGNQASGRYASVLGGANNNAGGDGAVVVGGESNSVTGLYAGIHGGYQNMAAGDHAVVSAGYQNDAQGVRAWVGGGFQNLATGPYAAVTSGRQNTASGGTATVGGGYQNSASGQYSAVSGGSGRSTTAIYDWRAGSCYSCTD